MNSKRLNRSRSYINWKFPIIVILLIYCNSSDYTVCKGEALRRSAVISMKWLIPMTTQNDYGEFSYLLLIILIIQKLLLVGWSWHEENPLALITPRVMLSISNEAFYIKEWGVYTPVIYPKRLGSIYVGHTQIAIETVYRDGSRIRSDIISTMKNANNSKSNHADAVTN